MARIINRRDADSEKARIPLPSVTAGLKGDVLPHTRMINLLYNLLRGQFNRASERDLSQNPAFRLYYRAYFAMMRALFLLACACFTLAVHVPAAAATYSLNGSGVVGEPLTYKTKPGESLIEIARAFDLGYTEIMEANPALDPFVPGADEAVKIPLARVLPDIPTHEGIVINVSEMRLYYFLRAGGALSVHTYPIGIGSEGWDTPTGSYTIIEKEVRPSWHVPESIRKERPELPKVIPPGPDNPLGTHALRLSIGDVLIHGTNKPWGVGRRVSHGCIRLYPEDIPKLFSEAPVGVKVVIVRQPVKVGLNNGRVFLEAHDDGSGTNYRTEAVRILAKKGLLCRISTEKLYAALEEMSGSPVDITE